MLSGIGPRDHLAAHNIPILKHLPGIGQQLKDHPAVFMTAFMDGKFFHRAAFESSPSLVTAAQKQWARDQTGEMSTQFSSLPVMFNKMPHIYDTPEFHSLENELEKAYLKRDTVPSYEAIFMGPKFPPTAEVPHGKEYLNLVVFGMNPQGSGTVTLASADPKDAAIIDPRTLSHRFDMRVLVDGIIDAVEIFKGTDIYKEGFEGWLNGPESFESEDVEKFAREQALLVWHAKGLRVADMSVNPVTIK
jgi:choline dehydrogenase-like flavoprotein